jgi:hypothetical protein
MKVIDCDNSFLGSFCDSDVFVIWADRDARDALRLDGAWDELLLLLLDVVHHHIVPRREDDRGFINIVHIIFYIAFETKHMPGKFKHNKPTD